MTNRRLLQSTAIASCLALTLTSHTHAQELSTSDPFASGGTTLEAFRSWRNIRAFSDGDELEAFRAWRNIRAFEEGNEVEAFRAWRNIRAFRSWRNIRAFSSWRNIRAFGSWRNIRAFEGYPDINAFGADLDLFWDDVAPNWEALSVTDDSQTKLDLISDIVSSSEAFWGDAVAEQTGLTFSDGFANALFEEYGIDLTDASSLDDFSIADIVYFHFDWHDGLMNFTCTDHVDWWMSATNWTPEITETQGGGDTVIGLIDYAVTADSDLQDNIINWSGSDNPIDGHGGAVASLLVADHDGQGVMGIAPMASVVAVNPFDDHGKTDFDTVANAVQLVANQGAAVVNLSLGAPGYTFDKGWVDLYENADIKNYNDQIVFVHAAGNDGLVQSENIEWKDAENYSLLVVGSVGFDGTISDFSNTPGDACFTDSKGKCKLDLKDRFLVAPGEFILVTDGEGGVTRASGTSFAAPLVTGAIALLQDRWPWLRDFPEVTADIILLSAQDLGEEGVDDVYGHGLLDIEAAQAPLDFEDLNLYTADHKGELKKYKVKDLNSSKEDKNMWNTEGGYFVAFEEINKDLTRDFIIPMEDGLIGTYTDINGVNEMYQSYLQQDFVDWAQTQGFANSPVGTSVSFAPLAFGETSNNRLPYRADIVSYAPSGAAFRVGQGDGATKIGFARGSVTGAANPLTGGANPILGFASGGAYGSFAVPLNEGLTLSFGATERRAEQTYTDPNSGEQIDLYDGLEVYRSHAVNMAVTQSLTERLSLTAGYTALTEDHGLLGMQSLTGTGFGNGSETDAATVGFDYSATETLLFSLNATYGETQSMDNSASMAGDDIQTSAYEMAVTKLGMFGKSDALRLALVQPMHIEAGSIRSSQFEVIDRSSGEIGLVENSFNLTSGQRRLALETRYGIKLNDDQSEISTFYRIEGERGDSSVQELEHMFGGTLKIAY